jgi:hypothetical protein
MVDKTIPDLTAVGTLGGTEQFHLVDEDGNSRKVTLEELKTYVNTNPTIVPSSEPWRGARAYRTADLSIANNTTTVVTWQAEDLDTDAIWSGGAPTRMTVPASVTKVRVTANIRWAANATGPRFAFFLKNGVTFRGCGMSVIGADTSTGHSQNIVSAVIEVTAGDYFEVGVFQVSGGALNLDGLTRQEHNWFQLEVVEG